MSTDPSASGAVSQQAERCPATYPRRDSGANWQLVTEVQVSMGGGPPAERGDDGVPGESQDSRNEIKGSVFGPAIQARHVYGGIHVHDSRAAVPAPRQLPPPVDLSGR